MSEVTVVLTSCNRQNELKITLQSFFKFNTYHIKKFIIIDDSGKKGCIDEAIKEIPNHIEKQIIYNDKNIGQIKSIDKAYSFVDTEYIFHCEDDWEFYDYNFIEISLDILKKNKQLFCVWLREYKNFKVLNNEHSIEPVIYDNYRLMGIFKERTNIWSGFTFNPGLRRTSDCKLLLPYQQFIGSKACNVGGVEQALSNLYFNNEFRCAITLNEKGFVKHIGWNNSTQNPHILKKLTT
tara:strand:+ start:1677 stop:2387 length:711 start_codon:yes stop_codon:yes gene_type:complete